MRRTDRRGANAIEFALTLPVFLMLVAGIFDWSWYAYQRSILKVSVTQACRAASLVDPGVADASLTSVYEVGRSEVLDRIEALGGTHLCRDDCEVTIEVVGDPPGRLVQCTVSGVYTPLWGMHVGELGVWASDRDRLAWQRWPAGT